jgi:hypothetical protein
LSTIQQLENDEIRLQIVRGILAEYPYVRKEIFLWLLGGSPS